MKIPLLPTTEHSIRRELMVFLLIVAAAFAVYWRIPGHEFLFNWDDNVYVTGNEAIRGFTWSHLKEAFSSFYVGNYAPLHIVSYMLDYSLWGMNPKGYLLTGILIHACNGFLAYRLFLVLDGRLTVAVAAALIFLLHPVQVESVAWISERKTVLAAFFSLLSFNFYLMFLKGNVETRLKWYFISLAAFLAAILCKSVSVVVPVILIALDWLIVGGGGLRKGLKDKIPFVALAFAIAYVTVVSQRSVGSLVPYLNGNPVNNAMTMMPVFVRYLGILFWPATLSPIYKPPIKTAMDIEVILSFILFVLLLSGTIFQLYRRKLTGFALILFFAALLPVSHIFPLPTLMQDRYLYFPMMGFSLFAVVLAIDAVEAYPGARRSAMMTLSLLILLAAFTAHKQTAVWRDSATLWAHAAKVVPQSKQAWAMLAATRHELKDFTGAEEAYLRLLAIAPKDREGLNGIGILYGEKGNIEKSVSYLRKAVEIASDDPGTLLNFGYAAFLHGEPEAALGSFNRALGINPALLPKLLPVMIEIATQQNDMLELDRLNALAKESGLK